MRINYKKELNKEQYKAVIESDGAALVLAGAGSGKTRVLIYRVAYLIENGVSPENILLVTFTNKAANEMLTRVQHLLKKEPKGIWGGTFHHIANRLLRKYAQVLGYKNNFTILDREDSLSLLKQCYNEFIDVKRKSKYFPKANIIYRIISLARNKKILTEEIMKKDYDYLTDQEISSVKKISERYKQKKKEINSMDFDDLLINLLKLLSENINIKEQLSRQFQYVLVDEYQDTNRIQADIIQALSEKHKNILAVGDDSQSIYSFRAADISNILNFPKRIPNTKIYKLETNYRSIPQILDLANQSISNNKNKYPKNLKSIKASAEKPIFILCRNNRKQAEFVIQEILKLQKQGIKINNIAVLFRSAFQALELELALSQSGILYVMRGGMRFFDQKHIKDVVAYLKILTNFRDEIAWQRILRLYEGIGLQTSQKIFNQVKKFSSLEEVIMFFKFRANEKVLKSLKSILLIFNKINKIKKNSVGELVKVILQSGYMDYLKTNFDNFLDRIDDLTQLANFSVKFKNLDDFLAELALSDSFQNKEKNIVRKNESKQEKLVLSTIHQAKGLEWDTVFLIGLVDGQFPHRKVYDYPQEMEEERRLFYVAVTRTKNRLYLIYPTINNQNMNINELSTFVSELDEVFFDKIDFNNSFENLPTIEY
ncbi:MAG: UvrD-helicase domain-containing protein, partial [Xanthomonadaceae bacterium]|nr:UvrD-helicase domain-containing protein [Rhodospirillaceae bacterium]NIA18000.1 UvrD-helicase domain-containing protein [Xanthomonadaceae bacterium]